ncbi:type II toxin-antitoxin system VapC family toxin [Dyadobacter arcticus]|uniref:Nucleic acid-binding protein n=1 Tax=Dyadobacter arcticus TaxID=1078754 RepID=A0ABX0UQ66_9BACT|nr:type II toxin-antitoxin system VapC family toxin [Dyadobacter arcticus]NIJ55148.1 putative nucleic acid-binding protein [Dyadobacter arcticus]
MNLFLDTSSLIKLYHEEQGTEELDFLFQNYSISKIYLSEISKVEFASAFWKKTRTGELSHSVAAKIISLFESDYSQFSFILIDEIVIRQTRYLLNRHGVNGLRTLDGIQLACASVLGRSADLYKTNDRQLEGFFVQESLPVKIAGPKR